jgi:hypothetical protein
MVFTTILFTHTTFLWATCCLISFIPIVKPFLTHWSWLRLVPFIECGKGAHGGCDRSTGDAYSSMAPDPTSGVSRGPCKPDIFFTVDYLITWTGHRFWQRIFPFIWLGVLIFTADCSLYLIWTHWFWLLIFTFDEGCTVGATGR